MRSSNGKRPRILMLASTFPAKHGDGTPEFVGDLASELAANADVLLLVPRVKGAEVNEDYRGVTVRRFRYFPRRWEDLADGAILENLRTKPIRALQVAPFMISEWWSLKKLIRSFDPDLVHAHWIVPQGLVVRLATRKPMLLTTLGGDLYALDRAPIRGLMSWVIRGARAVTVMNQDMKSRVERLGGAPENVRVIPMGANLTGIIPRDRRETSGPVKLLFVGRLVPKKGVDYLLRALRRLPDSLEWTLTIVGDGPSRSALEELADGLPVTFVGAQNRAELRRTYSESDVLVTPSVPADSGDQDGLPVSMLEAMCAGLPVIASAIPGIDEVVQDGFNGYLVPAKDEESLTGAIASLIEDSDLREKFGARAKEVAREHSTEVAGNSYEMLISEVLAQVQFGVE